MRVRWLVGSTLGALALSAVACTDSSSGGLAAPSAATSAQSTQAGSSQAQGAQITSLRVPQGLLSGQVTLAFRLTDASASPSDLEAEWSRDGGATWQALTLSQGSLQGLASAPAPGLEHTLTWESAQDVADFVPNLLLRLTPGGQASGALTSAPLAVDNQPLSSHVSFNRRPYLQSTTRDGVHVLWRTQSASKTELEYGRTPALGHFATVGGTREEHHVHLQGLQEGTRYYYRIVEGGFPLTRRERFSTAPAANQGELRFVVVGDSGMNNPEQYAIANRMAQEPAEFFLHTGDVVYPIGGLGAAVAEYNNRYFKPYQALLARVPSFPVVGNHDLYGLFGKPYKDTFVMPPNGGGPLFEELYFAFEWGDAKFVAVESNTLHQRLPWGPHMRWLEDQLQNNTKKWLIVYMHAPLYSAGKHGDNARLQRRLGELFERNKVDMVLAGHDHNYERSKPIKAYNRDPNYPGLVHVVTGGGGAALRPVNPTPRTHLAISAHHYMRFHIQGDWIRGEAVDINGQVLDSFRLRDQ